MNWLIIAIIAHFVLALVFVIDKYLLSHTHLKPASYAFYVGAFGGLAVLLIPFGFSIFPINHIMISLLAGTVFILAVFFFYKSIQLGEVSRIAPIIGGMVPIFTFILTYFILNERLTVNQLMAFSLLVLGGVIMAWPRKQARMISGLNKIPLIKRLPLAILASFLFAGSYVLTKLIFTQHPFLDGFIWMRLGGVLGALLLFLLPVTRRVILETSKEIKLKTGQLAVFNKIMSGLAFILLNYAIFLGSVTLINALQGVQYIFLLVLTLFLSKKFPQIMEEQINKTAVLQKITAILFIIFGLGVLVYV